MSDAKPPVSPATPATPATPTTPGGALRTIKLLLIGDSEAGKSSLLLSYAEERFLGPDHCVATVGVDFRTFRRCYDDVPCKVCIWDTAGQERFRALTKSFYRDALVVFVVFDIGNRDSFHSLDSWCDEVSRNCGDSVLRVLVANKSDISDPEKEVSTEEALAYAVEHNLSYREVSAKTMNGVQDLFDEFAKKAIEIPPRENFHSGSIRCNMDGNGESNASSIDKDSAVSGSGCYC